MDIRIKNVTMVYSHAATMGPYIYPYVSDVIWKNVTMIQTHAGPHMKGRCNMITTDQNW